MNDDFSRTSSYDDIPGTAQNPESVPEKSRGRRGKKARRRLFVTAASVGGAGLLALAVVGTMTLSSLPFGGRSASAAKPTLTVENQPTSAAVTPTSATSEMSVAQVAAKVTPSVVGIVDYQNTSVQPTAEGSGIVLTADGYIATNAHVISGADKIQVVVPQGKTYTAKVIGSDTKTDLAVLKIDTSGVKLAYATLGDSSQLALGQNVVAIGNPGGLTLSNTVTNGIVSGLNRTIDDSTSDMKYIQTNALINPGNSGGPLVNMYGQVVGITSSKIEETGFEGIGFAIPINTAKTIINDLITNGYVTGRVQIGVSVYPLSTAYTQARGLPSGLYITAADQTGTAYAAGLRAGDIITKIDGVSLSSDDSDTVYSKFTSEETKYKVGQTVTLTVYRYSTGNILKLSVKLAQDKGTSSTTDSAQSGTGSSGYGSSDSGSLSGQAA